MSKPKPEPVKAPFQQQQQQTNTYAPFSAAGTQEGKAFLSAPLDYGSETNVDPGVGRRTAVAEQEADLRANSALSFGVPRFIREMNRGKEVRDIQAQGAYEAQNAEYLNQQGNNQRRGMVTQANLARLERLLPQFLQTGGSGASSGYNTQVIQPQGGGFLSSFGSGLGAGLGGALPFI